MTALAVDEGIQGYRDITLIDATEFCTRNRIPLIVESLKDNFAVTIDAVAPHISQTPCSVCGVFRRYLLNKHREFDVLATGHNLDDETQSIVMNLLKNQPWLLAQLGPRTGTQSSEHFLQRVKPLYFCAEKEVMTYSYLKNFKTNFVECPYAQHSFRMQVRDALNSYEYRHPGTKINIVKHFLEMLPTLKQTARAVREGPGLQRCGSCGGPSATTMCKSCELTQRFNPVVVLP